MTKSIIALATAILAATTLLTSAAEAGFKGRLFGDVPPYLTDYNKEAAYESKKRSRKRAYKAARRHKTGPAKATKKASSVAKVEKKVEEKKVKTAESENSSISTANGKVAQAAAPKSEPTETVAAAKDVGCKKFFASVGMTLSVLCE